MAISTYASYLDKLADTRQRPFFLKQAANGTAAKAMSTWVASGNPGATPTTPAACNSALAGAAKFVDSASVQRLTQMLINCSLASSFMLVDRLSHQGGLSGTDTNPQTTNLPTAALTRYTSGVGVWAAVEIYTAIGTSQTTFSCTYTNQAGVGGRVSPGASIGSSTYNVARRMLIMPLQQGDTGVRSVEDFDLVGSTGTAGNIGITLFKPLVILPVYTPGLSLIYDMLLTGQMPVIENGACLSLISINGGGAGTGVMLAELGISVE